MLTGEQKHKLSELMVKEHVAVLVTQGEQWSTATIQAFAETEKLELLFLAANSAEKYQNAMTRPNVTVIVDTRDLGEVETFDVARASIQGVATDVPRNSPDWDRLKGIFLTKNPFEAPFFGNDALRIIKVTPKRVSYASGLKDAFKAEF